MWRIPRPASTGSSTNPCHPVGSLRRTSGIILDYDLADGEDSHAWADRLTPFLVSIGVRLGTVFDVFPNGWEPGMEWRRVEVFGVDRRRADRPGAA